MSSVTGSLFHLAATPGTDLEQDFDAGLRDLDAVRTLLAACRNQHRAQRRVPRLVFASSFAVFGGGGAVDDRTRPAPRTGYGTRQAITELLLAEATRCGFVDARSVRLPTVLVRPGGGEREFTGFASRIVVEPLAGGHASCPVAEDCVLLVGALAPVVDSLVQAHELEAAAWPPERTINLPASSVPVGAILDALAAVGGEAMRSRVTIEPDPAIEAVLRGWPAEVVAGRALELGFPALPVDLALLIRSISSR
jgi:nucleoside-diphosphate-sugar epimerase